jgi:hypothetical protein
LAWSDNFTLYSDYCSYSNYVNGGWVTTSCPRNNVDAEAGVSHDIDLPAASNFTGGEYTQVAKVNLYPATVGSANVVAQYAHQTVGIGGITAGFSGGEGLPAIGFEANFNTTYEKSVPTYKYFEY